MTNDELLKKWASIIPDEGSTEYKENLVTILENQEKYLDGNVVVMKEREANVGVAYSEFFPIIRQVYPSTIANDIVSVQPMAPPLSGGGPYSTEEIFKMANGLLDNGKYDKTDNHGIYYIKPTHSKVDDDA